MICSKMDSQLLAGKMSEVTELTGVVLPLLLENILSVMVGVLAELRRTGLELTQSTANLNLPVKLIPPAHVGSPVGGHQVSEDPVPAVLDLLAIILAAEEGRLTRTS